MNYKASNDGYNAYISVFDVWLWMKNLWFTYKYRKNGMQLRVDARRCAYMWASFRIDKLDKICLKADI